MRITLIFTSNELNPNFSDLSFRDESIGYIPPLSLLYVAGIMEKEGVDVQIIDMDVENLFYKDALLRIQQFSPDIIGFTLSTYSFHPILKWINKFKADTNIPILCGGAHVGLYPEETMTHGAIDYIIIGEAELPLPEFISALRDKKSFHGIKSLGFRENGKVFIDKTKQAIKKLDDIPLPARHLIQNDLYKNIFTKQMNFTAMLSTRGCPYRCAFCDQKTPMYRIRSAESFLDEIKANYEQFGIREFDIYDSTFTANKKRVLKICQLLEESGLELGWTIRSRVDSVNKEMLKALKNAGCHTIMYGIESADREILKRMNKDISPEKITEIISYTKEVGIEILGFFLFGFPGETHQTIKETIKFSLDLPLDYAQYTVLLPFPDTEVYEYYMENGLSDYWSEYTLDPENERIIELIGTEMTRSEASKYLGTAYRKFYFRPRIILRRAMKMKSFDEFKRLAKGAINLLKNSFFNVEKIN